MSIPEYLISSGYKTFKRRYINKQWVDVEVKFDSFYSTMSTGDLMFIFKKDGKEIIYGLNERGKPPTLIYPRPNVSKDDVMNRILEKFKPNEIIELINL